ncbi:embryo defective 2170 [Raphanus sativus]|uniref:Uncharacterized protein LOC108830830 n=1 Tax=Raphanus sativus TaxID=3726 RepID=A0A6J0LKP4_RAPSA|nr:uncharacterized protein LOC108830830 [Raphanus sativus]KAJ4916321.1 embryo defective 2170 [Raphanus sativus]
MLDPSAKTYSHHLSFPTVPNDHSDSGVCSPTLWSTSPPRSPLHRPEHYSSLSPDSKAQAIARGQRELMEMVSKMPESCYELSLKDLVEARGNEENNDRKIFDELTQRTGKVVRKTKSGKRVDPSVNNGGFLLKMMFPFSFGSNKDTAKKKKKKKKRKGKDSVKDSQVSPRPSISDESVKTEDREWWNRLSESRGSESTKRSGSSNSNRSLSSIRDKKSSCLLSFLWFVRSRD